MTLSETQRPDLLPGVSEGNAAGFFMGGQSISGTHKVVGDESATWVTNGAFYRTPAVGKLPVDMIFRSFKCRPTVADPWKACDAIVSPKNYRLLLYGTVVRFGWVYYPEDATRPIGYVTVSPSREDLRAQIR